MKFVAFKGFWTSKDLEEKNDHLFLFGDNEIRKGKGGQAIIRDLPNAFGIRTKKLPTNEDKAFWSDLEYKQNKQKIDSDFSELYKKLETGKWKGVVVSENGLGTGLAQLDIKAPKTFKYLQLKLEELKLYLTDVSDYIKGKNKEELEELVLFLDDIYYNTGNSVIPDSKYDTLVEKIKPKLKIGAKIREGENRVKLPFWLGSLDKITPKEPEKFERWKRKYNTNFYLISEKLDGVSCLYIAENGVVKLYTRGDGTIGADISYLAHYIKIPKIGENIAVRGELIIEKDVFYKKYSQTYKNPRNMVSGLVGSKTARKGLTDINFVAYEIVEEKGTFPISQYEKLEKAGFNTAMHIVIPKEKFHISTLSEMLLNFKEKSKYEMDGIVVQPNMKYTRNTNDNPDYMFAFKMLDLNQVFETEVLGIEWNVSKWGQMKPVVLIKPVEISGVTITRATGHNAKYVFENNLGKGSVVKITRSKDVIPYILEVISGSEKPDMPKKYKWDENKVNIIYTGDDAEESCKKLITEFFNKMGAKHVAYATVDKIYDKGLDNVLKIVAATEKDLLNLKVEGIEKKSAKRIVDNIKSSLQNVTLPKLLGASSVLGYGIGERKLKPLFQKIPDILDIYDKMEPEKLYELITGVEGFSDKTTVKLISNLKYAKLFLEKITPYITFEVIENNSQESQDLKGLVFVFTGFRDAELQEKIEKRGGAVKTSVSGNTTAVVRKEDGKEGDKITKAKKLGKPIYLLAEFKQKYKL